MNIHRIKQIFQTEHTPGKSEWKGAVLFLFNEKEVFFIKRSETMPTHPGQIAFVGGLKKEHETHPYEVCVREFVEETGFEKNIIELIGCLPIVLTSGQRPIVPVLAQLLISREDLFQKIVSNGEWDEFIAYPWEKLLKESYWDYFLYKNKNHFPVLFHTMRDGILSQVDRPSDSYLLWGATARIVWNFLNLYYKDWQS